MQCCRDHLLGGALRVVARLRSMDGAAADVLRGALRPLASSAGALLSIRFGAATAHLTPGLGGVGALTGRRKLSRNDLVDQRNVRGNVEEFGWELGGSGLRAFHIEPIDGTGLAHAASPFSAALRP